MAYYIISLIYKISFNCLPYLVFSDNFLDASYIFILLLLLWNPCFEHNVSQTNYYKLGHKPHRHCIQKEVEIEATTKLCLGVYLRGLSAPFKKNIYIY